MEKLKNILNPGSKKDDEVMYGSGQSSDPVHSTNTGGVSGQGSHFGSSQRGTDPLSSSTNPTSSGVSSGYGSNTTGTGQQPNLSGNPTSRSNMPGGFDDGASTASIKSGVPGHPQSESGLIGSSGTGESLDTNKPLPHTPGSGLTGSNTTAGPHSSNLANRADPRIDPDLDGSRGLGRGTTGAGSTGTNLPDRSVGSSGYGANTDSSHLGRDAAVGAGGVGTADLAERDRHGEHSTIGTGVGSGITGSGIGSGPSGYRPEAREHDHQHHGHRYEGDPCSHGSTDPAGPHFTSGPHATDTANRLDPHVAGGAGPLEGTSGTGHHSLHQGRRGDSTTGSGVGSTGIGSGISSTGTGSGIGATGTGYDNRGDDGHLGRDATLAGGAGAAGVGAYEAGKHHHVRSDPAATSAGITTGPSSTGNSNVYSSSAVDPRVDSTPRSGMTGTGNDHRYGRDAGVAGAGGLAAYEAEKHHHGRDESGRTSGLSGTTAGTTGRDYDSTRGSFVPGSDTQTSGGHHYGHDAGAGAVGGAEFSKHEAEKHRTEERHDESHEGKKQGGLFGFLHRDKNPKEHESTSHSSHGSHHGAEAAGVGAAGAGTAAHEYEKHDHDRNRLHKDAPKGYASQVTGGTGTTALAEGESVQRGPHASGLGNKLDPSVAGRGDSLDPGEVTEPHTGLPMNVGKYGSGAGGTDDTPVPGFHNH